MARTAGAIANDVISDNYGDMEGANHALMMGEVDSDGLKALLTRAAQIALTS